jgi:hypothetical protein
MCGFVHDIQTEEECADCKSQNQHQAGWKSGWQEDETDVAEGSKTAQDRNFEPGEWVGISSMGIRLQKAENFMFQFF